MFKNCYSVWKVETVIVLNCYLLPSAWFASSYVHWNDFSCFLALIFVWLLIDSCKEHAFVYSLSNWLLYKNMYIQIGESNSGSWILFLTTNNGQFLRDCFWIMELACLYFLFFLLFQVHMPWLEGVFD